MEYPHKKKPFYKRARKVPLMYRYPRTFYFGVIGSSMLVLFSRVIYDLIYHPATIDPTKLDPEERARIADRSRRLPAPGTIW